jgi:hypothetical protein
MAWLKKVNRLCCGQWLQWRRWVGILAFASTGVFVQMEYGVGVYGQDGVGLKGASNACVVIGAEGEAVYGSMFKAWAGRWGQALGIPESQWIGGVASGELTGNEAGERLSDRERIRLWIEQTKSLASDQPRWLVLLGHGTYDGKSAKFNLRGEDLSALQLQEWLSGDRSPWIIVVSCASSGPFLQALSGPNRVVIVSTKSGSESNFSRFGEYMSASLNDSGADLDHDGSISVLEAFLVGSRRTQRYYSDQRLLATEHALIEDNSDGLGTSHEYYRGIRPISQSQRGQVALEKVDGLIAKRIRILEATGEVVLGDSERLRLEEIEKKIEALGFEKGSLSEDLYYERLEVLFLEMAKILYPGK